MVIELARDVAAGCLRAAGDLLHAAANRFAVARDDAAWDAVSGRYELSPEAREMLSRQPRMRQEAPAPIAQAEPLAGSVAARLRAARRA